MLKRIVIKICVLSCVLVCPMAYLTSSPAYSGMIELSGGFYFGESNLGGSNRQWTRRWTLGIGYNFWQASEIEFAVQDILYRTKIDNVEDTTFHDQIYSINWIQYLASKQSPIIPFVKLGIGQLNREASGSYWTGGAPPAIYDSITAVIGAGIKFMFTRRFGFRCEATSYLTGGSIATWKDNVSGNFGFSIFL